ncbi:MAG: translation termination factor GTPase eRF3 [Watsoniomyces obsoletus]|nr:MAG: translation termination factor GTPase eRF3 [Watsoniomyces obsoletus]
MEVFLGKITQQAMNYAIRSGIAITSSYAIRQCSRLLENVKGDEYDELYLLQQRLDSKIKIISPAIDMIELISARGNTSLESAVTLTKSLRWEIQSLGVRLAKMANAEESSRRGSSKARTRAQSELEVKLIMQAIRRVLNRIEDAVPLINLAITTSGANLSTSLPATVSPSRLLQASTFLTAGDTKYAFSPEQNVQIGPTFTLSMYMLFSGHGHRWNDINENVRETTWKEVIHKARVKIRRTPLQREDGGQGSHISNQANGTHPNSFANANPDEPSNPPVIAGERKVDEFAYEILIIEDLHDDRVHSFDEDEAQPGPYDEVELAGIREIVPIYQVSKIFYADTGKILNIGSEGEVNSPVLLLKRDINAIPPRRMEERRQPTADLPEQASYFVRKRTKQDDEHARLAAQFSRESPDVSFVTTEEEEEEEEILPPGRPQPWSLPLDLDPEWIAFEVYAEHADSDIEDDEVTVSEHDGGEEQEPQQQPQQKQETNKTRPSSSRPSREPSLDPQLTSALAGLHLDGNHQSPGSSNTNQQQQLIHLPSVSPSSTIPMFSSSTNNNTLPIRTSLSLLEMLIRLTALQQFQQASHLSIPDELLNFFLSESSTTGAGGDSEERRRKRYEARRKVGFDPYDESPLKPRRGGVGQGDGHGDEQQYQRYEDRRMREYSEEWSYDEGSEYGPSPMSPMSASGGRGGRGGPWIPRSSSSRTYRASPIDSQSRSASGMGIGSPSSPLLLRSKESVERDMSSPSIRRQQKEQQKRPSPLRKSISELSPVVLPSVENIGMKEVKVGSSLRKDATSTTAEEDDDLDE